jgi:hypothetical protein
MLLARFRRTGGAERCQRNVNWEQEVAADFLVRRRLSLLEAELDDEIVGLQVERGICYGFNPTASRVWTLLEQPKRFSELRDHLLAEFDVPAAACEQQLLELLRDLEKDELVQMEPIAA